MRIKILKLLRLTSILGLPTILFFHEGQLVHRQTDELSETDLKELVTSLWPDAK